MRNDIAQICEYLLRQVSYREISLKFSVSKSVISYHAHKLELYKNPKKYDWQQIQDSIDEGMTFTECQKIYGFNSRTFYNAIARGKISQPTKRDTYIPAIEYAKLIMGKPGRGHRFNMKIKLIREGISERRCAICDLDKWLGQDLPLRLDHIDGDAGNFTLDNLRLLCGNCDSLQDTFCHKNTRAWRNGRRRTLKTSRS